MPARTDIQHFLNRGQDTIVIDVRSEAEYAHAHVPGAVNIPLLSNDQRKIVGTTYKEQGHEAAVIAGFGLVGNSFGDLYRRYREAAGDRSVIFYCWRGGLRSQISATLYEWGTDRSALLGGGYKAYRRAVLHGFSEKKRVQILSGFTGTGKTEILHLLQAAGEQVIDIEGLARHKGSALGSLGMPEQLRQEMFENLLFEQWRLLDAGRPVFLENESRKIGANVLPEAIWEQMQQAPVTDIEVPKDIRLQRILKEYGHFAAEDLKACTERIKKRLGGLNLKLALEALDSGDTATWAAILMDYYDRSYLFGRQEKDIKPELMAWDWSEPQASLKALLAGI